MKGNKRVENILPSGILVIGLAAMALFGVGFSAFQTSNAMSPIENSVDVEVGSIIEGGKTVLEITGTQGFGREFGLKGGIGSDGAFDETAPTMSLTFAVYHDAATESGYVTAENQFKLNSTLYSDEISVNFFLHNLEVSCGLANASLGVFVSSSGKAKHATAVPLTSGAASTTFTLTYTLTETEQFPLKGYYDIPFTIHYAVEGVKA